MSIITHKTTLDKTQSSENTVYKPQKCINNVVNLPYTSSELRDLAKFYIDKDISLSSRLSLIAEQVAHYEDNPDKPYKSYEWLTPNQHSEVKSGKLHPFIHPEDYNRLESLGIDPEVILLNVQSTCDPKQTKRYLGYPLVATGYALHSVNPVTGETNPNKAIVFRPSKPITDYPNQKLDIGYYVSQCKGDIKGLLFFNTGKLDYYQEHIVSNSDFNITKDIDLCLYLLSNLPEIPTVALPCQWSEALSLITLQKELITKGRLFNLFISVEDTKNDAEHKALLELSKNIVDAGAEVRIVVCDRTLEDVVMDDVTKGLGVDYYKELLEKAYMLPEYMFWRNETILADTFAKCEPLAIQHSQTKDELTRLAIEKELGKLDPHLRSERNCKRYINAIADKKETNLLPVISGLELLSQPKCDIEWIVPGMYARKGLSVVAGKAGTGKSLRAYNLQRALAEGSSFLGKDIDKPYTSLLLAMDESKSSWTQKVTKLGLYDVKKHLLEYMTFLFSQDHRWTATEKGLNDLRKILDKNPVDIIFIDSLKKILPPGCKITSDDLESMVLTPLADIASEYNSHIHIIHHTNRNPGDKDYKGSGSLADSVNYLSIVHGSHGKITETIEKQRDGSKDSKLIYEFDFDGDFSIKNVNSFDENTEQASVKASKPKEPTVKEKVIEKIVNILDEAHIAKRKGETYVDTFTVADMVSLTGSSKASVSDVFAELAEEGYLLRVSRGKYTATELFNETY